MVNYWGENKVKSSPTLSCKIHSRWIKELRVKNEATQKIRRHYREIFILRLVGKGLALHKAHGGDLNWRLLDTTTWNFRTLLHAKIYKHQQKAVNKLGRVFAIESKTGIFNILKKQPQNDKKNVRERTGISRHRRRNTDSQEYFHICAPSSNKTQIKTFQSHKFAKMKGSLLLIAAMCNDIGSLTSHCGECELVQSFCVEGSLTMCSTSLENSQSF